MSASFKSFCVSGAIAAAAALAPTVHADLVTNGGFETGNLSGWTLIPAANGSDQLVGGPAHSGNYAWVFGATGGEDDTIQQALATSSGEEYQVSFWLDMSTGTNNQQGFYDMTAKFGGNTLFTAAPPGTPAPGGNFSGYKQFTYDVAANSNSTILSFAGQSLHGWWELDDVSVTDIGPAQHGVPESPAYLVEGLTAVAALAIARRRFGAVRA